MESNVGNKSIKDKKEATSFDFKKRFHRLAENDVNSDCEFIVGPQKIVIKGHKVIFSAASEVFQAMLFGHLKEDNSVKVEDLDPEGFRGMKLFIYIGEITFTCVFHALSTYIAARKYLILELTHECRKFIEYELRPSDVLEFGEICRMSNISEFDDLCSGIIKDKTHEVLLSSYFVSASIHTIELILKCPSLKLKSEIEVYDYFERWALAEIKRRNLTSGDEIASSFNNLKKLIRFDTINGEDFVSRIADSVLLTRDEKYDIALNQMKFNSNMMCSSMLQHSRKFDPDSYKEFCQRHMFKIPVLNLNGGYSSDSINSQKEIACSTYKDYCLNELTVRWSQSNEFITFELKAKFYSEKTLIVIKSELRVLAPNICDDLAFESESKFIVDEDEDDTYGPIVVVLAVIPQRSLQKERFYRCLNKKSTTITIQGLFTVKEFRL